MLCLDLRYRKDGQVFIFCAAALRPAQAARSIGSFGVRSSEIDSPQTTPGSASAVESVMRGNDTARVLSLRGSANLRRLSRSGCSSRYSGVIPATCGLHCRKTLGLLHDRRRVPLPGFDWPLRCIRDGKVWPSHVISPRGTVINDHLAVLEYVNLALLRLVGNARLHSHLETVQITMAPIPIATTPPKSTYGSYSTDVAATKRPNIYLLEDFPPPATKHARSLFDTVLPTDPRARSWRQNADAILVRELTISREDITTAKKLRAIGKQGTGIDIIDAAACQDRNIPILNTPGVNAQSVAELVLTLTMAVARQLRTTIVRQARGETVRKEHCCGTTLSGKPIGIVGMGAIGSAVARIFQGAFNCKVYACDPFAPEDAWGDIPHTRVQAFEEMLPHVEMLTLHVPLTERTRGMLRMEHFRAMRRSAVLINVARGGIVDEGDLVQALDEGLLFGAGLDCHEEEPPTLKRYERLWATGQVVSTPHIGATTADTQIETAVAAIDNVHRFLMRGSA